MPGTLSTEMRPPLQTWVLLKKVWLRFGPSGFPQPARGRGGVFVCSLPGALGAEV